MTTNKLKQFGLIAVLFSIAGFLFYYSTWTEEERLILSDAKLKGKITYKGKPVPYALVIVSNKDSSSAGPADAYGDYVVDHAPVGEVSIGVNTQAGRGMMMSAVMAAAYTKDKGAKPTFLDVPTKYFDPMASGIKTKVTNPKSDNTFDIELK
jgi:hypothetical protein